MIIFDAIAFHGVVKVGSGNRVCPTQGGSNVKENVKEKSRNKSDINRNARRNRA